MHWKETVLKQKDIKWKQSRVKYIDDDKADLIINIPLGKMLEQQAYLSFLYGIQQALKVCAEAQEEGRIIDHALLAAKFEEWGLKDIWEKIEQTK